MQSVTGSHSAEELIPTLEKAFSQKVPVIIDCPVDYRENMKLTERLRKMYEENTKTGKIPSENKISENNKSGKEGEA